MGGELHVATTADIAAHTHDHIVALGLEQTVVAVEHHRVVNAGGSTGARFGGSGDFIGQIFFAGDQIGQLTVTFGFQGRISRGGNRELFAGGFTLLHQLQLLIFESGDFALAGFDLVFVGLVLVIAPRLILLDAHFADAVFQRVGVEFQFLAITLKMLALLLERLVLGRTGGSPALEHQSLTRNGKQLGPNAEETAIAILKDQQFLDDREHEP